MLDPCARCSGCGKLFDVVPDLMPGDGPAVQSESVAFADRPLAPNYPGPTRSQPSVPGSRPRTPQECPPQRSPVSRGSSLWLLIGLPVIGLMFLSCLAGAGGVYLIIDQQMERRAKELAADEVQRMEARRAEAEWEGRRAEV